METKTDKYSYVNGWKYLALRYAKRYDELGLLYKASDINEDTITETDEGDIETIYSVTSLIVNVFGNKDNANEMESAILKALMEKYPDHV